MKVSVVVSWIFTARPEHELQKGGLTEIMNGTGSVLALQPAPGLAGDSLTDISN